MSLLCWSSSLIFAINTSFRFNEDAILVDKLGLGLDPVLLFKLELETAELGGHGYGLCLNALWPSHIVVLPFALSVNGESSA